MVFRMLGFNDFDLKFYDPNNKRFEVPQTGVFPIDPLSNNTYPIAFSDIIVEYTLRPFDIKSLRRQNLAVLFSTKGRNFVFSDKYLEISTQV